MKHFLHQFILTVLFSVSVFAQQWDTTFTAKVNPDGKENTIKISAEFIPKEKAKAPYNYDKFIYKIIIDGKEAQKEISFCKNIFAKTITVNDNTYILILGNLDPFYFFQTEEQPVSHSQHLYAYNEKPVYVASFSGEEISADKEGNIIYTEHFGWGMIKRKCKIENNKIIEIPEKEYQLVKEKEGKVIYSFKLFSERNTSSSVIEKTYIGEKATIISCNLDKWNPDVDEGRDMWLKIRTEKGNTGWTNKSAIIEGKDIIWTD